MEGSLLQEKEAQLPHLKLSRLPLISVQLYDKTIKALVDTGAAISVMNRTIYLNIQDEDIRILPVSNMRVRGIIRDKYVKCTTQVLVTMIIEGRHMEHNFIVLPEVNYDLILGVDFVRRYGLVIDLTSNVIRIRRNQESFERWEDAHIPIDHEIDVIEEGEIPSSEGAEDRDLDRPAEINEVLARHKEVFNDVPGEIRGYEYAIRVTDRTPFKRKPYPVAEKYMPEMRQLIQGMEDNCIISRSATQYLNPLAVVRKADGKLRMCLDARWLNERIIPEYNQPPAISETLRKFRNCKYFTAIDLTSSYYHVKLSQDSRPLTGFIFDNLTYVFNRLPFGLKSAGSALIGAMDRCLSERVKEITTRYVDDILIASPTIERHVEDVDLVLADLKRTGFRVNYHKSTFAQKEVKYLGFRIDGEGIRPNPLKIESIQNFPRPAKVKNVRQFLGVCQFFAAHCPNYTEVVSPLQELLHKNNRWKWDEQCEDAFIRTKEMMRNSIKLEYPNFQEPFIIQSDASGVGIASVLYQEGAEDQGKRRIISHTSRKLRQHEKHYCTTELEALAIVHSLQVWRKMIYGYRIVVRTDHKALTFMLHSNVSNERINRWVLYIQQFDIEFEHCRGVDNVAADFISRNPPGSTRNIAEIMQIELAAEDRETLRKLRYLPQSQRRDSNLRGVIRFLEGKVPHDDPNYSQLEKRANSYRLQDGILWVFMDRQHTKWRIVIPTRVRKIIIHHAHLMTGHGGTDKTQAYIQERFTCVNLRNEVLNYILSCDACQRSKMNTQLMREAPRPILPQAPRKLYAVDLYGPLPTAKRGNRHVFVVVDVFSKFTMLLPIQKANSRYILRRIEHNVVPQAGKPEAILTDHGSQFTSNDFREGIQRLGIRHIMNSIRHPQANPSERIMAEIAKFCRIYCPDMHWKWIDILPRLEHCINNTIHESTKQIPREIHLQEEIVRPWDEILPRPLDAQPSYEVRIERTRQQLRKAADKRHKRQRRKKFREPLSEGELVLVRKPAMSDVDRKVYAKFAPLFIGPYKIIKSFRNGSYKVQSLNGRYESTYNAANLKRYRTPRD